MTEQQIDWIDEAYSSEIGMPVRLKIWYTQPTKQDPDLYCEELGVDGTIIYFYVVNGAWEGYLDVINRNVYVYATKKTYPYTKMELIYG